MLITQEMFIGLKKLTQVIIIIKILLFMNLYESYYNQRLPFENWEFILTNKDRGQIHFNYEKYRIMYTNGFMKKKNCYKNDLYYRNITWLHTDINQTIYIYIYLIQFAICKIAHFYHFQYLISNSV